MAREPLIHRSTAGMPAPLSAARIVVRRCRTRLAAMQVRHRRAAARPIRQLSSAVSRSSRRGCRGSGHRRRSWWGAAPAARLCGQLARPDDIGSPASRRTPRTRGSSRGRPSRHRGWQVRSSLRTRGDHLWHRWLDRRRRRKWCAAVIGEVHRPSVRAPRQAVGNTDA